MRISRTGLAFTALYIGLFASVSKPFCRDCGLLQIILSWPMSGFLYGLLNDEASMVVGVCANILLSYLLGSFVTWFIRNIRDTREKLRASQRD